MSALTRARLSSFLAGVGVTTLACMMGLKQDIEHSHMLVMDAMKEENKKLSDRVSLLESAVSAGAAETSGQSSG